LLDKTLKRELRIADRSYIVTMSPLTLKLTPKGKRKGMELRWEALVNGDAALAVALNASVWGVNGGYSPCRADQAAAWPRQRLTLAAGSLVALIIWVYYFAMIFYFGAEFTRLRTAGRTQ
jgi:hypothetical protein